ncbi:MAG: hypothetical protein Q9194_007107, partial [Teloschistes cf. exilis]
MPPRTSRLKLSGSKGLISYRQPYRCLSCSLRLSQSASSQDASQTTHFGFESIPSSQKSSRVSSVFSSVASSYDTMNDLMSLGIHRLWKDHFVRSLNPGSPHLPASTSPQPKTPHQRQPWTMLDIAGGTGDIAFRILDHATHINLDHDSKVIVSDINPSMLAEGRKRSLSTPYANSPRLEWLEANAESLPDSIASDSIDLYTVAFGIRNFTHPALALREAYRVLKPGGVFACLEFSHIPPKNAAYQLFNGVYKRWSFGAIPLIGQLVAADRDSY